MEAFDDAVPEDTVNAKIYVNVRRNEFGPEFPFNTTSRVVSHETRPGHVVIHLNATDRDGVRQKPCITFFLMLKWS